MSDAGNNPPPNPDDRQPGPGESPPPPPPPQGGQYYPPPQAAEKKSRGCLWWFGLVAAIVVGLGIIGFIILAVAVDEAVEDIEEQSEEALDDASIGECGTDEIGDLEAVVEVTNDSSDRSNYVVEVVFETTDGSRQLDSSIATINGVESGQTASAEAITATEPEGEFTCRITDVTRFSDE